jgi:hypothetical protein
MREERMKKVLTTMVATAGLLAGEVAFAQPAYADCTTTACDQRFIAHMDSSGLDSRYTIASLSTIAHVICSHFDAMWSSEQVMGDVSQSTPSMSPSDVGTLVGSAMDSYCPGVTGSMNH